MAILALAWFIARCEQALFPTTTLSSTTGTFALIRISIGIWSYRVWSRSPAHLGMQWGGHRKLAWAQKASFCVPLLVAGSNQACAFSSGEDSRFLTVHLWVPLVFKPAKRTRLSHVNPQYWVSHYMVPTAQSPGRLSETMWSPSFSVFSPRAKSSDLIASLPFLPDPMLIFLYSLGYMSLSASFQFVCSENFSTCTSVWYVHRGGKLRILLFHHLALLPYI